MQSMNWKTREIQKRENLGEYYWYQGFFHFSFGNNAVYKRDFDEIHCRDLALFTLGDIFNKNVIDIGCGSGLYSLTFLKMGASHVAGQDISANSIDQAVAISRKNGFDNFTFIVDDCQKLQFDDNMFDLAFSGDVFEHISKELKINFINETYRVLKPGGVFTIKTPNKSYLQLTNFMHRTLGVLKLKNPFSIHIPHTRNNPDCEHHGLSTYKEFKRIFRNTMFHEPEITYVPLNKNRITRLFWNLFPRCRFLNPHIIITVKKPIFYGIYK